MYIYIYLAYLCVIIYNSNVLYQKTKTEKKFK